MFNGPETYLDRIFIPCLVTVMSYQGWDITTIEEVGNKHKGYHPIQTALAQGNGSQCGTTTTLLVGLCMAMYRYKRTWNYYVLQARDVPQDFRVYFRENSYSGEVAHGAKVTGEPPICMSVVVPFAMREAIVAARLDSGFAANEWFPIDGPYTTESICISAATNTEDFKFN